MKLSKFIEQLQQLKSQAAAKGLGDLDVYYRHGASGDCGELSSAFITDETGEQGPFDLKPSQKYISIYAGN